MIAILTLCAQVAFSAALLPLYPYYSQLSPPGIDPSKNLLPWAPLTSASIHLPSGSGGSLPSLPSPSLPSLPSPSLPSLPSPVTLPRIELPEYEPPDLDEVIKAFQNSVNEFNKVSSTSLRLVREAERVAAQLKHLIHF